MTKSEALAEWKSYPATNMVKSLIQEQIDSAVQLAMDRGNLNSEHFERRQAYYVGLVEGLMTIFTIEVEDENDDNQN